MKIGIDCRMLSSKFGIGRYAQQLVWHLQESDSENQYVLFLRRENWEEVKCWKSNFIKVLADIPWYSWQEQVKFKKIIDKENVDLMHFPHWNIPIFYNRKFVVTIHDLIMYHYPRPEATTRGRVLFWLKDKVHRIVIKHAVKRAKKIIVTSEFTRQDLHQTLNVPLEKMCVTYQAPFGLKTEDLRFKDSVIDKSYILYVGAAYPHKNLEGLLKAWKIFCDKYGGDYKLVLVGKASYFYNNLKSIRQSADLNLKSVIHLDNASDDDLVNLYKNTSLFVFPSLYEGFGLPPLEAMKNGAVVASSNRSCLPEVLGEAAIYFDPENYEQMADIIYKALTDEDIRQELKNNSQNLLLNYSWSKLASQTLRIYKSA